MLLDLAAGVSLLEDLGYEPIAVDGPLPERYG